jgi:hypothetical protein
VGDAVTAEEEAALDAELQALRARAVTARTAAAELRRERASLQNELAQHGMSSVRTPVHSAHPSVQGYPGDARRSVRGWAAGSFAEAVRRSRFTARSLLLLPGAWSAAQGGELKRAESDGTTATMEQTSGCVGRLSSLTASLTHYARTSHQLVVGVICSQLSFSPPD